ncbi:MAG: FMN-binding protein [Clostridia bacterium]|nr:FMN-binding protein [Clostridia bacterium]
MNKFSEFFKANKDDILKPVVVLLSICIIIPLALSLTNKLTSARIAALAEENEQKAMALLIKADSFEPQSFGEGEEKFDFNIAKSQSGEVLGYIFVTAARGYGGDVSVMTAIGTDGKIIEISILDVANETPGLGQNVTKEAFYSQYEGKTADVKVLKNGANSSANQINAWTGATISSKAVNAAVNKALANFGEYSNKVLVDTGVTADEK